MISDSFLVSTLIFAILTWTQYPSVPGGDSGELIAEACILGTAHPPGYPLFIILSKIVLIFGNILKGLLSSTLDDEMDRLFSPATLVNTMCCFFGGATCYYLSESIRIYLPRSKKKLNNKEYEKDEVSNQVDHQNDGHLQSFCGTMGGMLFALSPLTWEYSRMAEVFALNNFLITLIVYYTILVGRDFQSAAVMRHVLKGAFISGLALSNQHTSLLFIVPIAAYVVYMLHTKDISQQCDSISFLRGYLLKLIMCFVAGLSPYLYSIVSSHLPSPGSWGDQTSFIGFFRHVLRSEYGTFSLAGGKFNDIEGSFIRWVVYIANIHKQFTAFGIYLSVIGIFHIIKVEKAKRKSTVGTGVVLFGTWVHYLVWWNGLFSNLPLTVPMSFEIQSRFYMQPNILICFFAGVGLYTFITKIEMTTQVGSLIMKVISRIASILTMGLLIRRNGSITTVSKQGVVVHDYARAVLDSLPQNSLLLSYSDLNWNPIRYLQECELQRQDVTHLSLQIMPYAWFERQKSKFYDHVIFPELKDNVNTDRKTKGYSDYISNLLQANLDNKAIGGGIYIEMQAILDMHIETGGQYRNKFTLLPWGMLYRVLPKSNDFDFSHLRTKWQPKSLFQITQVRKTMTHHVSSKFTEGSWEFAAMSVFWNMHYQLALHILGIALSLPNAMKKDHDLLVVYVNSLRVSSKLLSQVVSVNTNQKGIVDHSERDIIKNNALSQMRYHEATKMTEQFKSKLPSLKSLSKPDLDKIDETTAEAISAYLNYFYQDDDSDYEIFDNYFYKNLISQEEVGMNEYAF